MPKNTICTAKVVALCRYHGANNASYSSLLRSKLAVAQAVYFAAKDTPEIYTAYEILKETQKAYYATNQGLEELEEILEDETLPLKYKHEMEKVLGEANTLRAFHEQNVSLEVAFPKPPKPYKPLPDGDKNTSSDSHLLSSFESPTKESVEIIWDESTHLIISKVVSMGSKQIGKAETVEEAIRKATKWFNENF